MLISIRLSNKEKEKAVFTTEQTKSKNSQSYKYIWSAKKTQLP